MVRSASCPPAPALPSVAFLCAIALAPSLHFQPIDNVDCDSHGSMGTGSFHNVSVLTSPFLLCFVPFPLVLLNLPLCDEPEMGLGFQLWK